MAQPGFRAPDFTQPIRVADYLDLVPDTATIKGLFLSSLLDTLGPNRGQLPEGRARYVAFKDYRLVDQVRLIAEVAALAHPGVNLREAIRRLGHSVYPAFGASLVGRVLFAAVGRDPGSLLRAGTKAYELAANVGKVEIIESNHRSAVLHMRDMFNYLDCYQVGIVEGAFSVLGLKPTIQVRLDSLTSGAFELNW